MHVNPQMRKLGLVKNGHLVAKLQRAVCRQTSKMNPFKKIKDYFNKRDAEWTIQLNDLGFHAVTFPIMLTEGVDIDVVCTLKDFASDPDLYFHEYDERNSFIDSKGHFWTWKYDQSNKTNLPGTIKSTMTVDEVRKKISDYYKGTKTEQEINQLTNQILTIDGLLNAIADKL